MSVYDFSHLIISKRNNGCELEKDGVCQGVTIAVQGVARGLQCCVSGHAISLAMAIAYEGKQLKISPSSPLLVTLQLLCRSSWN